MPKPRLSETDLPNIKKMYEAGLSVHTIASKFNTTGETVRRFMRFHKLELRRPGQLGHYNGPAHPNWKGEDAGNVALHNRVRRLKGNPKRCEICNTTDSKKIYEWANVTGRYADPDDYVRLCRPCHRALDGIRHKITGTLTCPEKWYRQSAKTLPKRWNFPK